MRGVLSILVSYNIALNAQCMIASCSSFVFEVWLLRTGYYDDIFEIIRVRIRISSDTGGVW